jgi:hypothetical protein
VEKERIKRKRAVYASKTSKMQDGKLTWSCEYVLIKQTVKEDHDGEKRYYNVLYKRTNPQNKKKKGREWLVSILCSLLSCMQIVPSFCAALLLLV